MTEPTDTVLTLRYIGSRPIVAYWAVDTIADVLAAFHSRPTGTGDPPGYDIAVDLGGDQPLYVALEGSGR